MNSETLGRMKDISSAGMLGKGKVKGARLSEAEPVTRLGITVCLVFRPMKPTFSLDAFCLVVTSAPLLGQSVESEVRSIVLCRSSCHMKPSL